MPDIDTTITSGVEALGYRRGATTADPWVQAVWPVRDRIVTYSGRAASFITPGRAAVLQRLICLHNATGSTVKVSVQRIKVDMVQTAAAVAIGVVPPIIQIVRFTALPTGGTALAKVPLDTTMTSNASLVVTGDASAHGTSSATALAVTSTGTLSQTWSPRLVQATATAANSVVAELIDTAQFFYGEPEVTLGPLEGVAVILDQATVTTGNPATNRWLATIDWEEWTRP